MKKVLLLLLSLLLINVSAKETYFVLEEVDNQLFYDEKFTDIDDFSQEIKVSEKKTYTNEIEIRNNSNIEEELFLLFESKAEDGSYNDVMDYLSLKIMVDDQVVYEGSAEIVDFASKKEDLHDFISVGKMKKKGEAHLTIEMTLSDEYTFASNNQFAYVTWKFYRQDKDKEFVEIEKSTPETLYNFLDVWVFCGVCVLFGVLILSISYYRKKHPRKEKEEKKKEKEEEENKEKEKSK